MTLSKGETETVKRQKGMFEIAGLMLGIWGVGLKEGALPWWPQKGPGGSLASMNGL